MKKNYKIGDIIVSTVTLENGIYECGGREILYYLGKGEFLVVRKLKIINGSINISSKISKLKFRFVNTESDQFWERKVFKAKKNEN